MFYLRTLYVLFLFMYRKLICYFCDFLTFLHFRYTSRRATENPIREAILEEMRTMHRKLDFKCYSLWVKMLIISKKNGLTFVDESIPVTEIRHSNKDFENE